MRHLKKATTLCCFGQTDAKATSRNAYVSIGHTSEGMFVICLILQTAKKPTCTYNVLNDEQVYTSKRIAET